VLIKTESNQAAIAEEDLVRKTRHHFEQEDRAQTKRDADTIAPDLAGMDVTSPGQRAGRPMSGWTLQQKLEKIVSILYFERSNADPTKTGIYLVLHRSTSANKYDGLRFLCGMETGVMPEFSVIEAEAHTVPDPEAPGGNRIEFGMAKEIRGWRTVLLRLMQNRVLSAHDIERYFNISMGRDSQRWQQLLAGNFELVTEEYDDGRDSGATGEDRSGDRTPDGDGEPIGGDQPEHGPADGVDTGNEETRRRDDGGESSRGQAQEGRDGLDDCAHEAGTGEPRAGAEELPA
jgi:hypothetical protein